ncbi:hypothetical protein GCM10008917_25110 [Paraclostridium tenue]|uniref:Uncharacterized protein n=1 Tax=Paraclostridium tenue TaxID=1737 RepID=A0ABN1M987_9FIRM
MIPAFNVYSATSAGVSIFLSLIYNSSRKIIYNLVKNLSFIYTVNKYTTKYTFCIQKTTYKKHTILITQKIKLSKRILMDLSQLI